MKGERLLLDTHVLLWWFADDPLLAPPAVRAIDSALEVVVSAASVWEIAIKRALGKLDAPDDLLDILETSGFTQLPIRFEHAIVAGALARHHPDPFDRMLVAQAQRERLTLVTADSRLSAYDVNVFGASDR